MTIDEYVDRMTQALLGLGKRQEALELAIRELNLRLTVQEEFNTTLLFRLAEMNNEVPAERH